MGKKVASFGQVRVVRRIERPVIYHWTKAAASWSELKKKRKKK